MVIVIEHSIIPDFLYVLIQNFKKFSLIFNAKKSAIVNIKNHNSEHPPEEIYNIEYQGNYKFLGI